MALFYFLRHGETARNAAGRLCGSTDVPLSDAGRRQARKLAARLKSISFEALYSSPLQRALETGRIVGAAIGLEPIVDPRLTELSYGAWEGFTYKEIRRDYPELFRAWETDPATVAPPHGETGAHLVERAAPFLADVAERHPRGNVVVACHRTVCRLLTCHIMGIPLAQYRQRIPMDNAALNIFETVDGKWHVVKVNDVSHLAVSAPAAARE
jgi:broad specificity phosphatase PhoE